MFTDSNHQENDEQDIHVTKTYLKKVTGGYIEILGMEDPTLLVSELLLFKKVSF
jgi:hypothetical protein